MAPCSRATKAVDPYGEATGLVAARGDPTADLGALATPEPEGTPAGLGVGAVEAARCWLATGVAAGELTVLALGCTTEPLTVRDTVGAEGLVELDTGGVAGATVAAGATAAACGGTGAGGVPGVP